MYGVPESKSEEGQDRQKEDLDWCQDLLRNSLKVDQTEYEIEKVIRLEKRNESLLNTNKTRPILIRVKEEDHKWAILKKAKNLKGERDPVKKRVGISKFMTKEEREEQTKLVSELKEKRRNGEQGW